MKIILGLTGTLIGIICLLLVIRFIGILIQRMIPTGGINESKYIEINGTKVWVSIYGKRRDNPVLLFLHGGPGGSMSYVDYVVLRKLTDDYTVVEWDQRNAGKSWIKGQSNSHVTKEMLMEDALEMTRYIRDYLKVDKVTLLGISWGSILGANLAHDYPEYYTAYIGASLACDIRESARVFREFCLEQSKDDPEIHALAESFDPYGDLKAQLPVHLAMGRKYNHFDSLKESDCNLVAALLFNPYLSIGNWIDFVSGMLKGSGPYAPSGYAVYEILDAASVKEKKDYQIPFYLLEGDQDYGMLNMCQYAKTYFDQVSAPKKEMRYVSGGHMMPMLNSRALEEFVHDIRTETEGE